MSLAAALRTSAHGPSEAQEAERGAAGGKIARSAREFDVPMQLKPSGVEGPSSANQKKGNKRLGQFRCAVGRRTAKNGAPLGPVTGLRTRKRSVSARAAPSRDRRASSERTLRAGMRSGRRRHRAPPRLRSFWRPRQILHAGDRLRMVRITRPEIQVRVGGRSAQFTSCDVAMPHAANPAEPGRPKGTEIPALARLALE